MDLGYLMDPTNCGSCWEAGWDCGKQCRFPAVWRLNIMVIDLLKVFLCFSELEFLDMRFPSGAPTCSFLG